MCHLLLAGYEDVSSFLNQLKFKVQSDIVLWKQMTGTQAPSILASQSTEMYVSQRNALVTFKDAFSGYSCARKMCHFLLACYEDVPSFLKDRLQSHLHAHARRFLCFVYLLVLRMKIKDLAPVL